MLAARVEQKNEATALRDAPLTTKASYKPYAGKPPVRFCAGGRAMKRASLPLQWREFIVRFC
jgi:hypothetical protein